MTFGLNHSVFCPRRVLETVAFAGLLGLAVQSRAASFDCGKALQADEKAVCASRQLSEMDVEMATRFEMMMGLVAMGTRGDMGEAQQRFLVDRAQCKANAVCLKTVYRKRIDVLKADYAALKSRGPF